MRKRMGLKLNPVEDFKNRKEWIRCVTCGRTFGKHVVGDGKLPDIIFDEYNSFCYPTRSFFRFRY